VTPEKPARGCGKRNIVVGTFTCGPTVNGRVASSALILRRREQG
jgi:hypothetical protein